MSIKIEVRTRYLVNGVYPKTKWIYYFSLCEAQFRLRVLNDLQLVLMREGNRRLLRTI